MRTAIVAFLLAFCTTALADSGFFGVAVGEAGFRVLISREQCPAKDPFDKKNEEQWWLARIDYLYRYTRDRACWGPESGRDYQIVICTIGPDGKTLTEVCIHADKAAFFDSEQLVRPARF